MTPLTKFCLRLLHKKQIKETDPVTFSIVKEAVLEGDSKNEKE